MFWVVPMKKVCSQHWRNVPSPHEHGTILSIVLHFMSAVLVASLAGSNSGFADGVAELASFNLPIDVSVSRDGLFALVADQKNNRIRRLTLASGAVSTLAGSSDPGVPGSADGAGSLASFNEPSGMAVSSNGSFALVADQANSCIRRISLDSLIVSTIAGLCGASGGVNNGVGSNARFKRPWAVVIAHSGAFALVLEDDGTLIRRIELGTGNVSAFGAVPLRDEFKCLSYNVQSGRAMNLRSFAISSDDTFLLAVDINCQSIVHIVVATRNVTALSTTEGCTPSGVAISPDGTFALVSSSGGRPGPGHSILRFDLATRTISTLVGSGYAAFADGVGFSASFKTPQRLSISSDGTFVLVADLGNDRIRRIALSSPCNAGFFCPGGTSPATQMACDAGYYCASTGLSSNAAQMACSAGFFCLAGSSSASGTAACAGGTYCPAATSSASGAGACAVGHFCLPGLDRQQCQVCA